MSRPRYKRNPSGGRKHTQGIKVLDDISDKRVYFDETTLDDDGNRVYTRSKRTYDRRPDLDDESEGR